MSYVEKILEPGEQIEQRGRIHWIVYWPAIGLIVAAVVCVIFGWRQDSIPLLIVGGCIGALALVSAVPTFIRTWTTELVMTDRRIIIKTGLIRRSTEEMNRSRIETVSVDQSVLGRILNYGTVMFRGTGGGLEPISTIHDPLSFSSSGISRPG